MADIVVAGGGFAGMWAALSAARENMVNGGKLSVVLVSREPFLTIRPRLYEANPQALRAPFGPALEAMGVRFVAGEVVAVEPHARRVLVRYGNGGQQTLDYARLVIATGSTARLPPIPGCAAHAHSIDDYNAAMLFDAHIATAGRGEPTMANNTFAIIGAGFTGVELACEMRDRIAVHAGEERAQRARIVLLEKADAVAPELGPGPRSEIREALAAARIELRTGAGIAEIRPGEIVFADESVLAAGTIAVTTGQTACIPSGLEHLARDGLGRLAVHGDLRVQGVDGVYAAGDTAAARVDDDGHFALMSCQHAMPMGKHAGYNAARSLLGLEARPYRQERYVTCLDLGRSGAVFTTGWDRKVEKTGAEAGALKRTINTQWIYPPAGTREDIIEASSIDKRAGR